MNIYSYFSKFYAQVKRAALNFLPTYATILKAAQRSEKQQEEGQMLNFLFKHSRLLLAVIVGCLMAWTIVSYRARLNPEAREQAFQSQLAECERLVELNGNDWRLKLAPDDTCAAVFEEYSKRVDADEERQNIDKAAAQESARQKPSPQSVRDSTTSELPDTEY